MAATSNDLLLLMAEHLDIKDILIAEEAMALWLVSPLLEIQLKPYHNPYAIYLRWRAFIRKFTKAPEDEVLLDKPLLVLRRNALLTLERELQFVEEYEGLTELLYLHARDEYLSGRYLVDIETAIKLVGLQLAIEFGQYSDDLDEALDLIYDNLNELAPPPHVKAIRSFHLFGLRLFECKRGLESLVLEEYRTASGYYHNNYERRKAFLDLLRATPFYGAAFFSAIIDQNQGHKQLNGGKNDILVGINYGFVTLIDPREHKVIEVLEEGNKSLNEKISYFFQNNDD